MKFTIPIRIKVLQPLNGVAMMVQRGKEEFLPPISTSAEQLVFDFEITVDLTETRPNFLGKYAQGPKDARFVYVNSGTYADQHSIWGRRAKISLMSITGEQIQTVVSKAGMVLQTDFGGVGRDGGPTCASVKGIEWKVVKR
ncbi:MAG: hypothetical protein KA746_02055 [Pyrinomonadaceae bacterium]|nr:hypothetical protein [Pyrinomonadaceae bacterium]MBP6211501.1 hypothetical protein [Pyrinomonadaceae bacterium]